jgi:quercetin dioxygenase-like cupin family protein
MSSRAHPGSERPLHGPLQMFDLGAEVGRLMEEGAWQRGQRNSITLRKGEGMNVVLLVMKTGDRIEEHAAPGPSNLSVREGASALWWRRRWPRRDPILCSPATLEYGTRWKP